MKVRYDEGRETYGDGLHDIPTQLSLEGKIVDDTPPTSDSDETGFGHVLGRLLSEVVAFLLDVCHFADLP
jgi:hypothetical protein